MPDNGAGGWDRVIRQDLRLARLEKATYIKILKEHVTRASSVQGGGSVGRGGTG